MRDPAGHDGFTVAGAERDGLYVGWADNDVAQIWDAGGVPGLRVSWQVKDLRLDPYAEANRIVVEQDNPLVYRLPAGGVVQSRTQISKEAQ